MMELTASTFIMFAEELVGGATGAYYKSQSATEIEAGIYVTASMWEDCDTWAACAGANRIYPEPRQSIPLHVLYREVGLTFDGLEDDSREDGYYYQSDTFINREAYAFTEKTATAKFFFPDSKLVDGKTYFLTLEFEVYGVAEAFACFGNAYASTYAGAELGPYIIDASIIKDADFGDCGWLEPEKAGCGLFDKLKGSADPDCEPDDD
jgi:hypothetical protein